MRPLARPLALAFTLAAAALGAVGCRSAEAAREHEKKGGELLDARRPADAEREFEAARRDDPDSVIAVLRLAEIYEAERDGGRARDLLEGFVRDHPGLDQARMNLASLYARLGALDQALEQYAIVGQASAYAPAFLFMADLFALRHDTSGEERAILAAIQAEPTHALSRFRLAELYDRRGLPQARDAWEQYVAMGTGNPNERAHLDEAAARLRVLAPLLTTREKTDLLATLRKHLDVVSPALGAPPQPAAVPSDAGPAPLRRIYPGEIYVVLRMAGAEPQRGHGSGATFYEAICAAAEDARRARPFDLYFATALDRVRAEAWLEVGEPQALTIVERAAGPVIDEAPPLGPDDGLEVKFADRARLVLPSDRAALGLATLGATLEWAARDAGVAAGEWRRASFRRVRLRGVVEAADGGGDPVDLAGGLPAPPPATRFAAVEALAGGARWIAAQVGLDGGLPAGFTPGEPRAATASAREQARAVLALVDASSVLRDPTLADAARLASRRLAAGARPLAAGAREDATPRDASIADPVVAALALRTAIRLGDTGLRDARIAALLALQRADGGFGAVEASAPAPSPDARRSAEAAAAAPETPEAEATGEAALALAEAATIFPPARVAALRAIDFAFGHRPTTAAWLAAARLRPDEARALLALVAPAPAKTTADAPGTRAGAAKGKDVPACSAAAAAPAEREPVTPRAASLRVERDAAVLALPAPPPPPQPASAKPAPSTKDARAAGDLKLGGDAKAPAEPPEVVAAREAAREAARALGDAVEAALSLSVDARGAYLYAEGARALGGFRDGPLDPRVSLEGTARLVSALAAAAPALPEAASAPR